MRLTQSDVLRAIQGISPAEFQQRYYPYIPKAVFHKILAKKAQSVDCVRILEDYKKRGMSESYNQFLKYCVKYNREIPKELNTPLTISRDEELDLDPK
jgi:hypothetical protein